MKSSLTIRRCTGIIMMIAFGWLMLVSAAPVSALGDSDDTGAIEKVGSASAPGGKKSSLRIVLIGVGVVAVAAVLILVVSKPKYDITGSWALTYNWGDADEHVVITFTGTKKSGTFTSVPGGGTYTVQGKKVSWIFNNYPHSNYVGTVTSKDAMSGTMSNEIGMHGTWSATKQGSTPATLSASRTGPGANGR